MGGNLRVRTVIRRSCTSSQIAELTASVVLMQGAGFQLSFDQGLFF